MVEVVIFSGVFAFVICVYILFKTIKNKYGDGKQSDHYIGELSSHSEEPKWKDVVEHINSCSWNEVSCENVRKFQYGDFPEIIYVIKTELDGMYLVTNEDTYVPHIGKSTLMTKTKVEKKYNIKLNER